MGYRLREKYLSKIGDDKKNFSVYLDTMTKQIKDIEHLLNEFSDFARMPKPVMKKIDLIKIILRSNNNGNEVIITCENKPTLIDALIII